MKIAVDFDGVLHKNSMGWYNSEIYDDPVEGSREAMEYLISSGHTVVIFSARVVTRKREDGIDIDQLYKVVKWLSDNCIPYHEIWLGRGKITADIYIDDRALKFEGNWNKTLLEVDGFKLGKNE